MKTAIHQLTEELKYASSAYYISSAPIMSDAEFDGKLRTLERLEESFPQFALSDSPTRVVGSDLNGAAPRLAHPCPMRSLRNIGTRKDLLLWMLSKMEETGYRARFMLEKKYDGVSVEVVYGNGRYLQACTRGDGYEGTDITENVRKVVPPVLEGDGIPRVLVLRGELVLPLSSLERINREGGSYSSARNAVSAFALHDDPATFSTRGAVVYFYQAMGDGLPSSNSIRVGMMEGWGLQSSRADMTYSDPKELLSSISDHENLRQYNGFDTDGVVIKVDQEDLRRGMPDTEKDYGWAVAYKFEPEHTYTRVLGISYSVGRTGLVSATAMLPFAKVGNVTVTSVSLNSLKRLRELDLHEGDAVRLVLGGDCIPYVESVDAASREEGARAFRIPSRCPVCGEPLEQRGESLYCTDYRCYARFRGRLLHFCRTLGFKGVTEAMVEKLVEAGATRFHALCTADYGRLRAWGLTRKTAEKMLSYAEAARSKPFAVWLEALAVPGIDKKAVKAIAASVSSLCELREMAESERLGEIRKISDAQRRALAVHFSDGEVLEDLEGLI